VLYNYYLLWILSIQYFFKIIKLKKINIQNKFGKKKFYHEDMKPGNCLVNQPEENKEEYEFKLADFGGSFCKDTLNKL